MLFNQIKEINWLRKEISIILLYYYYIYNITSIIL